MDKTPTFLFVPKDQVLQVAERESAIPYEIPGVELGHHGERCSFDAFLKKYKLDEPALRADTEARELTPEVARAQCVGHRVPGHGQGRPRQHGEAVPGV